MSDAAVSPVFRCGNLIYTRRGLVALFAWLLWGDFCFTLMESVVPSVLPLKLRSMDSANWLIGLVMSTLPGIFNTTVCPWVSFKSDRHRGRRGRRIPFILSTMPFLTASLVLIGFSDEIGRWLHTAFFARSAVRQATVIIFLLALFAACFDLFNMFVGSVYWYLFNDVVPAAFLGRFMAWFRAVGTLSGALYNYFIFQFAQSHMREIYLGASVLYFVGFGLMCLMVKERDYPPPDDAGLRPSLLRDIRTMARDCYTTRFYWDIFLATMFGAVGGSIGTFNVFFHLSLGLDLNQIGKLGGIGMVVVAGAMVFIGPLVDRWHPVRVMAYGTAAGAFIALNNWVWLFAEVPSSTFYFWAMVGVLPFTVWHSALAGAAGLPREMMLFPRDRFGQFCGAQALVRSAGTMIGGLVAGYYIDLMKLRFPTGNYVYRWNFVWSGLFVLVAFAFHYRAYRAWKRLGAEDGYQPPERNFRLADLPPRPETAGAKPLLALLFALLILGQAGLAVAYAVAHWRGGQSFLVPVFATQAVLQLALFAAYFAFIRFMERP